MADSSGTTLMDLITADPSTVASTTSSTSKSSSSGASSTAATTTTTTSTKRSKRASLMQIQSETISAAKAALTMNPVVRMPNLVKTTGKKKAVSYSQLARSIHELAAASDQKRSQRQLVSQVFPKLAVYNSVDPSLAPSLLMLHQQCDDRSVLRYVYYYLSRILASDSDSSSHGGIPTPNWDALADIDAVGGVTRADVVPRIVAQLSAEATSAQIELHPRRLQALKALTSSSNSDVLYEIVFGILDQVSDAPNKRKKGVFGTKGADKEFVIRSNLQYGALSALRRLPLDPGNPAFLHRAAQGVTFADPVAVRHSLEILSELAARDTYTVAIAIAKLAQPGGALQDVLHLHDVLARVALARLCYTISRARALDERPDIKSQFNSVLYQLLLDPSERVCFEAILCVLGKHDTTERTEERAGGWYRLTREILKLPEAPSLKEASKDKASKPRRPQPLIKLVMRRLESSFRSFSRPVLHAAARVVQEMGKSRAAAFALGIQDIDKGVHINSFSDAQDSQDSEALDNPLSESGRRTTSISGGTGGKDTIASLLASLMEVVRTTVACECVYVRAMVIKALIWMQSPHDSFDELKSIIASELSDPAWPATLLNDVLLTLHARFKATPDMAVTLLEIARIFATKVPGKIDADVLQLLWKTCLVGAGPDGKHTALEAVTIVLDLPPPQPGSMLGLTSVDRVSASDPKSALALQRLVQAAVWFLGENANYAASEYAWESATPPGTALMMLDADKMVAAASSRNPTLAGALTRLQRCAFSGSWEVRIIAAQALTTIAVRSGEPYRLQIYEFLHTLAQGGVQSQLSEMHLSNGEDQGASGTGLGVLISPMIKVLDEMYRAQDDLIKDIRYHDNAKKEWTDDELKKLYETHERLLDLVSLFCYVPRAKYLPLGPISGKLIDIYRTKHNISASTGLNDPAVATGISDLIYESKPAPVETDARDYDLVNAWATGLGDDGLFGNNAPAMNRVNEFLAGAGTVAPDVDEESIISRHSVSYDDLWEKTLLETSEIEEEDVRSDGTSSPDSTGSIESSISSHFGGMNYPSLFSSRPERSGGSRFSNPSSSGPSIYEGRSSPIGEEPPPYSSPVRQRFESYEKPFGSQSFESQDEERASSASGRLAFLIIIIHSLFSGGSCSDSDSLLRFKESLQNSGGLEESWNSSTPPCSGRTPNWEGLLCNKEGQVSGVRLENMSLSGEIDVASLSNLSGLRSLSLMDNHFQGELPDIAQLGSLKALYLSGNNFSGTLDTAVFLHMTSLKKVHMARNRLGGHIPSSLLHLPRLIDLSLEANRFGGTIPNFARRQWLSFNVSGNSLKGSVPSSLQAVPASAFAGNHGLCGEPLPKCPASVASVAVVAVVVVISLVAIAVVLAILWSARCRRAAGGREEEGTPPAVEVALPVRNNSESEKREEVGRSSSSSSSSRRLWFVREDRERFEMQDLLSASAEILGSGSLGSSYKAVVKGVGKVVVVKRCKQMNNVGGRDEFQEHMRRLGRLTHPNLLPLVAFYFKRDEKLLVTDFMGPNRSLEAVLRQRHGHGHGHGRPPWLDARGRVLVARGVARGLTFLQDELPGVMAPHGHLKASNVLLRDPSLDPVLTDYGLVPLVNQEHAQVHMAAYRSPEYLAHGRVTRKTDVWCLGVLLLHLLMGAETAGIPGPASDHDDLFDAELLAHSDSASLVTMRKLLRIAIACCDPNVETRLDIKTALHNIENLLLPSLPDPDSSSSIAFSYDSD